MWAASPNNRKATRHSLAPTGDYPNSLMGEAKAEYVLIVFDSLIKDDFLNAIEKNELKLAF